MVGRWNEGERGYRDGGRYDDRYDAFGRDDDSRRYSGREDRVFGERETGVDYNRPVDEARYSGYSGRAARPGGNWQDRDYGGVSPAMQRGDYDSGYRANPRAGGRYYGDDGRSRIYREEYGYGDGYGDGRRFGTREADERWAREMRRGYGDSGRDARDHEGFEDRARDAGEFFRRTGRRISNWFSDVAGEGAYDNGYAEDRERYEAFRSHRGVGPKGYKRSDERISDDAHQRLTDDPWIDASNIDLAVSGGEVTLSGTVVSREAKHRAERIVEDLSGVHHVQNNLRVQGSGGYFTSEGRSTYGIAQPTNEQVKDVTDGHTAPPAQRKN